MITLEDGRSYFVATTKLKWPTTRETYNTEILTILKRRTTIFSQEKFVVCRGTSITERWIFKCDGLVYPIGCSRTKMAMSENVGLSQVGK